VASYIEIIEGRRAAGRSVAIIGAGGIGFDVAEFLTHAGNGDGHASVGELHDGAIEQFRDEWGIDAAYARAGGIKDARDAPPPREVWLLQRKATKVGEGLAKTTGWIRRTLLRRRGVKMLSGVTYERIDDAGLHVRVDGHAQVLAVDTIVVCAGQEPRRDLAHALDAEGIVYTLIGGADVAVELDAKRAIEQGTRVALAL
jgi:2,4-dienoyl-CoA reductase (NADPH2)